MPYIGRDLNRGNYLKLDDISSSFNSSTKTFNLTVGGSAFTPGSAFSILVSVGGVIQEPESAYQVNNSEITFANAPTAQDGFFCVALGVSLGIGVPGNGTVNGTQMAKPFNYDVYFYLDDANNRVGIGSLQPKQALDIIGNTNISGILTASSFSGPVVGNTNNASGISTFYDLRVSNNLTVEGTTTTLDTNLIGVDRIEVGANSNTVVGVAITQSGSADILNLYDGSTEVFSVADGGVLTITGKGVIDNTSSTSDVGLRITNNATAAFSTSENLEGTTNRKLTPLMLRNGSTSANTETYLGFDAGNTSKAQWNIGVKKTGALQGDFIFNTRTGSSTSAEKLRITNAGLIYVNRDGVGGRIDATAGDASIKFSDGNGRQTFKIATMASGQSAAHAFDANGDLNLNTSTNQYGYRLNIQDSAIIYAQTASSGGLEAKWHLDNSAQLMEFGTVTTDDLALVTNNVPRLRILSGGSIGIGTTNPQNSAKVQYYTSTTRHQSFQSSSGDLAIVSDNNHNPVVFIK